jgi:diguanylate cyclase (GGDEF)-like protein
VRWPQLSIRSTLLAAIVAGMVLPALLVLMLDSVISRSSQEPVVERNRAAVMVLATAVFTEPAWTLSEPALQDALARVHGEPSVCAVEVLDLQPAAVPLVLRADTCAAPARAIVREAPVLHEGQVVARLRLGFDDTEVDALLAERRLVMGWLVAAQVAFGVAVLAGVLALRLLRPIGRLRQQAAQLGAAQAPAVNWPRDDELGQLGRHLGDVHGRLRSLIDALQDKNTELQRLALYDHLTGLPNRSLMQELFLREVARGHRAKAADSLALLFVDLDRFKAVNDTHGHAVGDQMLVAVAQRLQGGLRESDVVCRISGDEFLVLLPLHSGSSCDRNEEALATAGRLLTALHAPLQLEGAPEAMRVGASIGVALYPQDGDDFDALVRAADAAMYRSKQGGRDRISLYQPGMDTALRQRVALEHELRQALDQQQMRLHYQPVVDARDGRLVGFEALVRWQHPQRGLLGPDHFIGVAEAHGLIQALGQWVLDTACAQLAQWQAQGHSGLQMAVNVSALQLHEPGFAQHVRDIIEKHQLMPGTLLLELTESTLLAEGEDVARAVHALRAAGAHLAVDDFGTGYSSLAALKLVRPERLKMDRSFVRDLPAQADDRALAEAIFGMARALDVAVVAEGVETAAQSDWLAAHGAWLQQGYLWSRPLPAAELASWLEREAMTVS